jgi:hypothetical protein
VNYANEFKILLKHYRQSQTAAWRKKNRNPKMPKPLYPIAIEINYGKAISGLQRHIVDFAMSKLATRLPRWVRQAKGDNIKLDAFPDEFEIFLRELEAEVLLLYGVSLAVPISSIGFVPTAIPSIGGVALSTGNVGQIIHHAATKLFGFEEMQWRKQLLVVTGQEFQMSAAPWWKEAVSSWENTNYRLIKSLSQEYVQKLNTLVVTGIQSGWTEQEMMAQIKTLSDRITGARARLIARDQVGKFNSALAKAQYEYRGDRTYMWNTARDERVRGNPMGKYPKAIPSHWIMDNLICRWDDPTLYSDDIGRTWKKRTPNMPQVHVGQEICCRCLPSPIFIEIIDAVDKEIEEGQ